MGIQLEVFSLCQEIAKFDIWNIFYKGASEKTPGFNQGMNHVSNGPH